MKRKAGTNDTSSNPNKILKIHGVDENKKQLKKSSDSSIQKNKTNSNFKKKKILKKNVVNRKPFQQKEVDKPNWQELKKKNKTLKLIRKGKRNNLFDIVKKAKCIWEELRCGKCSQEKSKELTDRLVKLLNGKITNVVRSHDMSRIVQCLMKLGSVEVKRAVLGELIDEIVPMAQSKYAYHSVKAILKYGTAEIRQRVIDKFYGNIVKLLSSRFSAPLVEEAYTKYASKNDKKYMRQELYGDLYKGTKNNNISCLTDVFRESSDLKDVILNSTKAILAKLVEKTTAVNCSLVHTVLYDYLCNCNENSKQDILELLSSKVRSLLFTKYGSKVAKLFMWCANNKLKKTVIKDLKPYFKDIIMDLHGCMFLVAMIDSVDDTVLLKKCFLPAIISNAEEIAYNEHGRKVLLYLVAHRNPTYFHPADIAELRYGDDSVHIKKDCSQRMKELRENLIEPLLNDINSNPKAWFCNGKIAMVTLAILKAAHPGEILEKIYGVISEYITNVNSVITEEGITYSVIEHAGLHMTLKKLILHDKEHSSGPYKTFSECLVPKLTDSVLEKWIQQNRGCFILVFMIETGIPTVQSDLKSKLGKKALKKLLEEQSTPGAQILQKHLQI